jgi:hypothetical protein
MTENKLTEQKYTQTKYGIQHITNAIGSVFDGVANIQNAKQKSTELKGQATNLRLQAQSIWNDREENQQIEKEQFNNILSNYDQQISSSGFLVDSESFKMWKETSSANFTSNYVRENNNIVTQYENMQKQAQALDDQAKQLKKSANNSFLVNLAGQTLSGFIGANYGSQAGSMASTITQGVSNLW